jgi:DNA-binding XRE family transcriptional regulator
MITCTSCGSMDLSPAEETLELQVPGATGRLRVLVEGVGAIRCAGCGESFTSGPDQERAELAAAAEAIRAGLRHGRTFGWTRRALGLRATDLAALLDVSAETVSRWENGHRAVDRSVWNTLADLVEDRLAGRTVTADRLRQRARRPEAPLHVRLRPALA